MAAPADVEASVSSVFRLSFGVDEPVPEEGGRTSDCCRVDEVDSVTLLGIVLILFMYGARSPIGEAMSFSEPRSSSLSTAMNWE